MSNRTIVLAHSLILAACLAVPAFAADPDEALKKDLTAVIALQGMPCGEVIDVKVQAQNDYAVSCKDGNKYRVYENAKGRVVVDKQK
jgi:hypothetical protein